jgi:preprotein translocase subunit YajC
MTGLWPLAPVGSHAVMPSTFASSLTGTIFANADGGSGSSILSFLFLPLILAAMYFLMIRPQRKRMRTQQNVQQSIEVGHDVVTTSGIFGTITGEDGPDRFWLEIDDEHDVQIRIARAAIQNVVPPEDDDADADDVVDEATDDGVDDDEIDDAVDGTDDDNNNDAADAVSSEDTNN